MDKLMTMETIKEAVLSQKPRADLMNISKGGISYIAFILLPYVGGKKKYPIYFNVQIKDIGDRIWGTSEGAISLVDFICTTNR